MINSGEYIIESYAHVINVDSSLLKLNAAIEKFGYRFLCIDASEFEKNYSDILNIPKNDKRPLTIMIGSKPHGISHELSHAIFHTPIFERFMHSEFPEIILLKKIDGFNLTGGTSDFILEYNSITSFYSFVSDLLLQLRLYKHGEIRCSQYFQMTSVTRQISLRKVEISIGLSGYYTISDNEAKELVDILKPKYESNTLTELAIRNFSVVYDIPDGRIRYITLMTCLESLFNLGKDQIAHTIARHLAVILSGNKEQFQKEYKQMKKLYHKRNSIVHGGEYKGDLLKDYLDLSDKVRKAINYCNKPNLAFLSRVSLT